MFEQIEVGKPVESFLQLSESNIEDLTDMKLKLFSRFIFASLTKILIARH